MEWRCHDRVTVSTVTAAEEAERRHSEVQQMCGNLVSLDMVVSASCAG